MVPEVNFTQQDFLSIITGITHLTLCSCSLNLSISDMEVMLKKAAVVQGKFLTGRTVYIMYDTGTIIYGPSVRKNYSLEEHKEHHHLYIRFSLQ